MNEASTSLLDRKVEEFVKDIQKLAFEAAQQALEESFEKHAPKLNGNGKKAVSVRGRGATIAPQVGGGRRRSEEEVTKLADKILDYIYKNPGKRIEEMAEEMGIASRDMKLPISKLVGERKVSRTGQKRATKYFPPKGSSGHPRVQRRRKKKRNRSEAAKKAAQTRAAAAAAQAG